MKLFLLRRAPALATVLALAASAQPAAARQADSEDPEAPVQGVVVAEGTFEALEGATVELLGTDLETHTDRLGSFAFQDAPPGEQWIRVSAAGHPSIREQVWVTSDGVVFLQFVMPEVSTVLAGLFVDAPATTTAEADNQAQTAADLLALRVPSVAWKRNVGDKDYSIALRGYSSLTGGSQPILVVDDLVVTERSPVEVLTQIPADAVASIEVLRGPAAAFRYPLAANGAIVIKTKH